MLKTKLKMMLMMNMSTTTAAAQLYHSHRTKPIDPCMHSPGQLTHNPSVMISESVVDSRVHPSSSSGFREQHHQTYLPLSSGIKIIAIIKCELRERGDRKHTRVYHCGSIYHETLCWSNNKKLSSRNLSANNNNDHKSGMEM